MKLVVCLWVGVVLIGFLCFVTMMIAYRDVNVQPAWSSHNGGKVSWDPLSAQAQQQGGLRSYSILDTEQEGRIRIVDPAKVPGVLVPPRHDNVAL